MRGREIEKALGGHLADNFPIIDKFQNGVATSIKSLDLGVISYQKASTLKSTVTRYIDTVAKFRGERWADTYIRNSQIKARALDLVIPSAGTPAQRAVLAELLAYGRSREVTVNLIVYP